MTLPSAFGASVLLALGILMGYIGFDISRQLTAPVQLALGLALLLDVAALYLAVRGRRRAAQGYWAGVVLLLVGLHAWDRWRLNQERMEIAARIPGENDNLLASNLQLFEDHGAEKKSFVRIACATHFMNWERQRKVLHRASLEWLTKGSLGGADRGRFKADFAANIVPE